MLDSLPPPKPGLWMPEKPAIIRPAEKRLLRPMSLMPVFSPVASVGASVVVFVGGRTENADQTANQTINYPADVQSGDLILWGISADDLDSPWNDPAGWTIIQQEESNGNPDFILYRRFIGSSETSTTFDSTNDNHYNPMILLAFRNVVTINVSAVESGGSGMPNPPSVTVDADNSIVATFGFLDDDPLDDVSPPTGYSNGFFQKGGFIQDEVTHGQASTIMAATKSVDTGSENPGIFSSLDADSDDAWNAITVSLEPV